MGIETAIMVGGGLAAAGGIGSALISSSAQSSASDKALAAQQNAQNLAWQQYQQAQANEAPFLSAGTQAANQLAKLTAEGGALYDPDYSEAKYTESPYHKWLTSQGLDALMARSGATGNLASGNLGTALSTYAQNMAGSGYSDWYSRQVADDTNMYNRLMGLTNIGQSAASTLAGTGGNISGLGVSSAANQASTLMSGAAQQGNYLTTAMNNLINQGMGTMGTLSRYNAYSDYMNNQAMQGYGYGDIQNQISTNRLTYGDFNPYNWGY